MDRFSSDIIELSGPPSSSCTTAVSPGKTPRTSASQHTPAGEETRPRMAGARGQHEGEHQDPSFLHAADGPSISQQNPAAAAANSRGVSGPSNEYHDATTDVLAERSSAVMGRAYAHKQEADKPTVSFHVNPDFDNDGVTNSDVLLQGYEAHNRIPTWQQNQGCQQGMEDEGMSPSHAPRSPTSSRYPAPYDPPSPGASVRTGGMSNVLDRHYPQRGGSRRQPEVHQSAGGVSGSIAATAELSVLIDRAKHLLAHHDPARNSTEIQRLLGTAQYMQTRSDYHASGPLPPIEDQSGEVNDEELLQMHLDAKDNLRSAYAMLNDQYSAPTSKPLTIDALNELDSNGLKKSSENSDSKSDEQEFRKPAKQGPEDECEDPVGAAAVPLLTHSDYLQERETERRAKRMVRVKLFPMLLYISFILAWLLYAYVRVRHGMGGLTLPLIIYSYIVLVVEMLGGLNMIFYGCWLFAKPVNTDVFPPPDRETGKEAPFRRAYNVRVMIPCYKESLAIIQRTVLASKRADRPPGMKLVIYVCDDGNDEKKLAWVQRMNDPEVKYVTGRDKSQKQLNGKSANLNFCLTKLYPDIVDPENPDELMKIPVNELMCLFDADQTCSKGFFVTMLRYIDSGDDVGVALSPQLMYNVIPDCDVFNHQNVHFWEMMQPGMDAMGFISLTGTNMILRCRALHQAGWFPMNSVTEDWALGMRFKKLGYRCRYVNQYLAIGEAPDVTQQAFQQRSRWSKGHFQVFWSRECPLFDSRLNLFFRLAYSSTCVSYLSTGLSVIVLNIVPVLTILVGWFPIALNFYTVVGITAYFGALNALSYYCLSWSHYKALWLANNSSVILFWPYLKASIFTPIKSMMGRTMVFKTTLKGAAAHNASLKVLGPSILIVLVNLVTFILGIVNFHVAVNAAQGISLCWLVFNTIPHVNLLFYSAFGPGGFMVGWCKIGMFLTTSSSALAVILMWLLYPREVDFEKPLAFSLRFMQAQVSGPIPADFPVEFRADSGLQYRNIGVDGSEGVVSKYRPQYSLPSFNETTDLSGGFYEDGPWGPVKLTKSNALTTSNLAWAMLDLPGPYERDPEKMAEGLAMVEHGLKYLLNCYIKDPTDYGNAQGDIYVYQVGDIIRERRRWFRPEDVTTQEKVYYTGGVAAPIDLTGQMTAGIVAGTMLLHKHGRLPEADVSANMVIARDLFNVTMTIKGVLEHPREFWHSDSFYDDRLWAASWMYRAATEQYLPQELASRYYTDMVDSMHDSFIEENTHVVNQDYVLNMGIVHAAVNTFNWEFHAPAQTFIWDWICSGKVDYTTFGRAFADKAPLLGDTVMAASLAQLYSIKMKGWSLFHSKFERGFQCFAQQQARYLVGTGWQRKSFIQGINQERGYDRLVHRSASCPTYPEKCAQNTGGSDSKDYNIPNGGLLWVPRFTDKPRNTRGSNSTAVSLGNNIAMPILFAGLLEKTNSWMECLLSDGALLEHPVCSEDRPLPATDDTRLVRRQFWGRIFDEGSEDTDLLGGSNGAYPLTRNLGPLPTFKLNVDNFEQDLVSLLGSGWMFYEAQQSGRLTNSTPPNRIPWRGDSYINDGAAENRDLSGGWYDAGDTLKLSMPFCSTVWRLAWNLITFKEVTQAVRFNEQPIYTNGLRQLAHAAKYLEKMHTTNNTLVAAVGDRDIDHLIEDDRPLVGEQFLGANVPRPVIMLNQTSGGADLIAEACSAFAALGILFREQDPDYSNLMIKHARQLYDWMVAVPGTQYSRVDPMLQQTYPSEVPHAHMMLAAAWMFRLTGESKFESAASSFHSRGREQQINPIVGWNNPLQDAKLLLLEANPNSETTWLPGLQEWVDTQMFGDGDGISYSRKGLWYADSANWGVLRNAANMANIAMRTAAMVDRFGSTTDDAHMVVWAHHARCLARQQMNYIMGSSGRSFVTGWGKNPPKRPHHRGASCAFVEEGQNCTGATWNNPNLSFPNTLPGGLVGGPTQFDEFRDSHLDFKQSEVSLDYNAALVSAVSSMTAMPAHFWTNTNFCPTFPIPKVKWLDITVKPVPGVALPDTPEDGALIL